MPAALTPARLRLARMHAQLLAGPPAAGVVGAVRGAAALQAQDLKASKLAVRARTSGLALADVRRAVAEERSVIRTWAMRGTLHMIPTADAGWIVDLFGPVVLPRFRQRRIDLGLDDDLCERAVRALPDLLASGRPQTRPGVVAGLRESGVPVPADGQAPFHLLLFAALRGVVCRGPDTDAGEATYVLLRDWAGAWEPRDTDAALAKLARRHVSGYGPVGPEDFAVWSGLPAGQVRRAWDLVSPSLAEVATDSGSAWALREVADAFPSPRSRPAVRLLGPYDGYLLGYKERAWALPPESARRILPGGGVIHPAVLADGEVVARWRWRGDAVVIEPFAPLSEEAMAGVAAEVEDIGRFLGIRATMDVAVG
ncbi:winged helix DNA-binding domain-containing protein [Nocardiopsis sediminis]|uniref:Winged helix DNA-binding domain-containing protein n=1 Tax=Nocardiopsis sediminis TaxID=1778267 RepID=A0ABV8FV19_9ACTN